MSITAKVKLTSKTLFGGQQQLKFAVDYNDGRNKEWSAYTPTLNLDMMVKDEVADKFELGGAYTLTFEKNAD